METPIDPTRLIVDSLPGIVRAMTAEVRRVGSRHQLTMPQDVVLRLLMDRDYLVGELARELRVSMPTITQRSDGLIAKGLAERYSEGRDRRQVWLSATVEGRVVLTECRDALEVLFSRIVGEWNEERRDLVAEALADLLELLVRSDPKNRGTG